MQPAKAEEPMLVKFVDKVSAPLNPVQPENAASPIESTLLGIVNGPCKLIQPAKAEEPMLVKFVDKVSAPLNPVQPLKASLPIVVTFPKFKAPEKPVQPVKVA